MKNWVFKFMVLNACIYELKEELEKAKNEGKKINPKKVLRLIKLEKQYIEFAKKQNFRNLKEIYEENQTKYTDWIPLTLAEKLVEEAKDIAAPDSEEIRSISETFQIEIEDMNDE